MRCDLQSTYCVEVRFVVPHKMETATRLAKTHLYTVKGMCIWYDRYADEDVSGRRIREFNPTKCTLN